MPEPSQPAPAPDNLPDKVARLLEKRPPLPPAPVDARWSWTRQKLKAVYLEAFTDLERQQVAEAIGIDGKTLWKWRRAPDYRRYLAALIAADGLADRAARVKARKGLADKLGAALEKKMNEPGALAGEKLSSLLRAQREMLDALQDDATALQELGEDQEAAARAGQVRPGLDLAEKLAAISDPNEREIVKRHLLKLMGEYLDAPTIIEAQKEPERGAVVNEPEPERAPTVQASSMLDFTPSPEPETTRTPETEAPKMSAPDASASDSAISGDAFTAT